MMVSKISDIQVLITLWRAYFKNHEHLEGHLIYGMLPRDMLFKTLKIIISMRVPPIIA